MSKDIKVIFSTALINLTNSEKEIIVEASSVREVLEKLVSKYGDNFKNRIFESENKLRRFINMYVNGKDIRFLGGLETSVDSGDEITLLPAVSGGSPSESIKELTERDKVRYDRQIKISGIGTEGQIKLKNSSAFVAGAGGLGSPISIYLAVAGIGHITIVDKDKAELSNLNRQILHWDKDANRVKADSAKEKLSAINPDIEVDAIATEINEESVLDLVKDSSIIIDAMDNFPTRFVLNKAALKLKIPFVHGGVWGLEGRTTTIIPYKTACLRCVFRESPPKEVFPVIGVTPGIIGIIEATEAIKYLAGFGELLENRLLVFDGELLKFHEIKIARDPECPDCS